MSLLTIHENAYSKSRSDSLALKRMFNYASRTDLTIIDTTSYIYTKFRFQIEKKNTFLMAVPNLFIIALGKKREYVAETYSETRLNHKREYNARELLSVGTMPRNKNVFPTMLKYLTPDIYGTTLVENNILSPFNKHNRIFYRYRVSKLSDNTVIVTVKPRIHNTQTVRGYAVVNYMTGRMVRVKLKGEFDMVTFNVNADMGESGIESLLPKTCDVKTRFRFLGNNIRCHFRSVYGLQKKVTDSIPPHDIASMDYVRPEPLDSIDINIYKSYKEEKEKADSTRTKKKQNKVKAILWDAVGKNLLDRINSRFGKNSEGNFRMSPIINPLYLGYTKRRGVTYRFDMRGNYYFTPNSNMSLRFKGGYSFKQKQFYFNVPLRYYYDIGNDGYAELEFGNGNRITNSSVLDQVKNEKGDTIDWDNMHLDYFKDTYLRLSNNISITPRIGVKAGIVYHRRTPVDSRAFLSTGKPTVYNSFAPFIEIKLSPWISHGPVITVDYEQGVKSVFKSSSQYTRMEFDASYIHHIKCMRSFSMRLGGGFYMSKGDNQYFLDYTNFREEKIPGGWNDDWSGNFELLNSNWYNASEYYVRANMTYESPLLLLSWFPLIGKIVETERIYVSALSVKHLSPYTEYGYGFTNRVFSMGIFASMHNTKFAGMGVKFGFELFSQW